MDNTTSLPMSQTTLLPTNSTGAALLSDDTSTSLWPNNATTSLWPNNATTSPPSKYTNLDTARYIYFYGLAVVLPVGLLCNLLCFAVFLSSRSLRRTTTGHYLTALAVADTIFLLGELFRWLNSFDSKGQILGIDFMETITFWCRITFYLRYAGKLASAWITVVISAERFITVAYPLKVARISTPTSAKLTILCIYILCCVFGAYPFWTIGLRTNTDNSTYCGYTDFEGYKIWSTVILRAGSLFLPSAIIIIFTALILIFLRRAQKVRLAQLGGQGQQHATSSTASVDFQLTIMLVSVAIAFLVLRAPYAITYYLNAYKYYLWEDLDKATDYKIYLANKICDLIAISNYAVNFFLYCLCGSTFRARLLALFSCRRKKKHSYYSATLSSKFSHSFSSQKKHASTHGSGAAV